MAISRIKNDTNYLAYRQSRMIRLVVHQLPETSGSGLKKVARIHELTRFKEYFRAYKIVVYDGLNCDSHDKRTGQVRQAHQSHI
jgi:hypothetical protein